MSSIDAGRIAGKEDIVRLIQEVNATNNLKAFIGRMHEVCFEKCIPTPGSSMSRNDQACISNCVRKYIGFHDSVSKEWNTNVQKLQAAQIQHQ